MPCRGTIPLARASLNSADRREPHEWEQENDSYHWCKRECRKSCFTGSDPEGVQSPRDVQVKRRARKRALGLRAGAARLFGQAEPSQPSGRSDFRVCGLLSDSATCGIREQHGGRVQGVRGEPRSAEFGARSRRLREIVSELAPQDVRQATAA